MQSKWNERSGTLIKEQSTKHYNMSELPYRDKMVETSHYTRDNDDDEEEEEATDEAGYKTIKDAVLFAIGVSTSMLTPPAHADPAKPDSGLAPTVAALKCAYSLMQQRIISHPHDMMGVLLFGTAKSHFQDADAMTGRAEPQYSHCYLLTDLDVPAAADVKQLRNLVEYPDEAAALLSPCSEEVSMTDLLFCANQIFTTKAPNFSSRRLFLVTDNDNPHANSRDARNSAAVRAKDLYDLGVTIELFPISHPDRDPPYIFDRRKFYNDIVYSTVPSDPDAPVPLNQDVAPASSSTTPDGITLLQSLLSSIASRAAPRRAQFSNLPFEIGPRLRISVKGYIILIRQQPKRTSYIYLPPDGENPQIAIDSGTLVADDTARTVEKSEVRRAYKFGGETVTFSLEEMARIKDFGDPVLRIIGFKPLDALPIWASLKPSTFIYPSEEDYIGSTRTFSALHQKLLTARKFALAWSIPRRNASPRLTAILPSSATDTTDSIIPTGLWVKELPFADDIRQPPPDISLVRTTDPLTDAMRVIVQQLHLPHAVYDPRKYPNPSLQWFYRILQALALDEDLPEQPDDRTKPRWRQMHKRAGSYAVVWGKLLDEEFRRWQAARAREVPGGKRGVGVAEAGARKKPRIKTENEKGLGVPTDADMRTAFAKDAVGKLTVGALRSWLTGKGVKGLGGKKKGELVEMAEGWLEKGVSGY